MVVFPQSWERGKAGSVIPVLPAPCLCYHGMTPAPNAESGLIFNCDESILWGDDFPSDLIWLTQWKWGDLGSETWSVFLTSKVLPALILFFPPHFTHHFAVIYLSFLIFSCAAPSLFSASLTLSLQPFLLLSVCLHYLQCGKCPNFLPRLIIRCICQGHGLASGSNSPVHLGKEGWDLGRGVRRKTKAGGGCVSLPLCCVLVWGFKWRFMQNNLGGVLHYWHHRLCHAALTSVAAAAARPGCYASPPPPCRSCFWLPFPCLVLSHSHQFVLLHKLAFFFSWILPPAPLWHPGFPTRMITMLEIAVTFKPCSLVSISKS